MNRFKLIGHHAEFHDAKSDKFWRCYYFADPDFGVWVRQWGPCGAPVGQYKLERSLNSGYHARDKLEEKITKGYGELEMRSWEVTSGFVTAIGRGEGLSDLGYQFNQQLGGKFETPLEDIIAGLRLIEKDLQR